MKRILLLGAALSVFGSSAAMAQPGREIRQDRREIRHDRQELRADRAERRWARGQRLPRNYYSDRRYYVNDWRARRLSAPPRGYRWVQRDNNYLLVAATTGLIASVIAANH